MIAEFTDLFRGFRDSSIVSENARAGPSSGHVFTVQPKVGNLIEPSWGRYRGIRVIV